MNKELLQQALDALGRVNAVDNDYNILSLSLSETVIESIEALRAAIAQPVQPAAQLRLETALERAGAAESALRRLVDECEKENIPGWEDRMIECIDSANKLLSAQPAPPADDTQDAARYRWLRDNENGNCVVNGELLSGGKLDRAVDTLTKETK